MFCILSAVNERAAGRPDDWLRLTAECGADLHDGVRAADGGAAGVRMSSQETCCGPGGPAGGLGDALV